MSRIQLGNELALMTLKICIVAGLSVTNPPLCILPQVKLFSDSKTQKDEVEELIFIIYRQAMEVLHSIGAPWTHLTDVETLERSMIYLLRTVDLPSLKSFLFQFCGTNKRVKIFM